MIGDILLATAFIAPRVACNCARSVEKRQAPVLACRVQFGVAVACGPITTPFEKNGPTLERANDAEPQRSAPPNQVDDDRA